jgi:hypothetical protein
MARGEYSGQTVRWTLTREAIEIARQLSRGTKGMGDVVSRLLYEERARIEARLQSEQTILGYEQPGRYSEKSN